MKATKHHNRLLPLLFLVCLPFLGCETEPLGTKPIEENITLQEEFQLKFSLEYFDDPSGHVTENIEIDWDKYKTKTFDGKEWFEFEVSQKKPIAYSGNGEIQGQFFSLLAHKNEGNIKFFINKMLSFSDGEGFTYFTITERYYHGMVYLYNLKGEAEHLMHFEKGVAMHGIESIKVETTDSDNLGLISRGDCWEKGNTARCDSALDCALNGTNSGGGCGGGSASGGSGWTQITTFHFTDWYNNNGNNWSYNGYTYDGYSTEWIWVSGGNNSGIESSWTYAQTSGSNSTSEGHGSGGAVFSNEPPEDADGENDKVVLGSEQTLTEICGKYDWKVDQYSATVNISNIYVQALRPTTSGVYSIDVEFDVLCVNIPYQGTARNADITFNAAYERAKRNLMRWLQSNPTINDDFIATEQFKEFLRRALITSQPGSTISTRPCSGSATSEAKYCV